LLTTAPARYTDGSRGIDDTEGRWGVAIHENSRVRIWKAAAVNSTATAAPLANWNPAWNGSRH
jgi:hypothetical protein